MQLEAARARQPLPALITITRFEVVAEPILILPYYSVIAADTLLFTLCCELDR